MSFELKTIICGTHESIEDTEICSPLVNKIVFDPAKIKPYIASHLKSVYFIIVLLNLFGEAIDLLLSELENRDNIIGIFICGNQIYNLASNQTNVFHLSKRLLTCKITSYAIRSYESAAQKLYKVGREYLAYTLEQKSSDLKRWLTTNDIVKTCDVLIIPLNTTDRNLRDFQLQFIELCNDLCHDYEPRVCTLYDYISSDESDNNMSKEERNFVYKHNKIICSLLKKLAPIRIYLIGNEDYISNNWSKLMIESELDNGDANAPKHDEQCTFVQNEPVTTETIRKLIHRDGSSWKIQNIKPIEIDTIRNDIYFLVALDHVRTTFKAREMEANTALCLWTLNYHEHCTEYSSEFRTTDEARDDLIKQDDNITEMDNKIQSIYQIDPSA